MTAIFVLFMVAAQARDIGLSPQDIVELVPYVIPSTLPYTVPVSLLFAVTVVYGRLAGDNEIIAVKTAGLSVMKILWPSFALATGLSSLGCSTERRAGFRDAPTSRRWSFQGSGRHVLQAAASDHEFNHPKWPFLIKVRTFRAEVMIDADLQAQVGSRAERIRRRDPGEAAELHFDLQEKLVRVYFVEAGAPAASDEVDVFLINNERLLIPIPPTASSTWRRRSRSSPIRSS